MAEVEEDMTTRRLSLGTEKPLQTQKNGEESQQAAAVKLLHTTGIDEQQLRGNKSAAMLRQ